MAKCNIRVIFILNQLEIFSKKLAFSDHRMISKLLSQNSQWKLNFFVDGVLNVFITHHS